VCLPREELVAALVYAICGLISALWQSFALGWYGTSVKPLENLSHEKRKANPVPEPVLMRGHGMPCMPRPSASTICIKQAISTVQNYI